MIPEYLVKKYNYTYVQSCNLLNEPFVKDLLKENEKLKKELEELREQTIIDTLDLQTHKYQQQEFIKYLKDEIKITKEKWGNKLTETGYLDIAMTVRAYQIILQKYKSIIGGKNE